MKKWNQRRMSIKKLIKQIKELLRKLLRKENEN
jgi:hypothetical protein